MLLRTSVLALFAVAAATSAGAQPGSVHADVPVNVSPSDRYVIYLHGRIIEEQGVRPSHPRFGTYEYQQVLEALAASGAHVVSERRPAGTNFQVYASRVAGQVRTLLEAGVPAEQISVIGFSKGGAIAILAAALLQNERVGFVLLAPCGDWLADRDDVDVRGRILSIFEASDELGRSCAELFGRATAPGEHREIEIHTGQAHGAFYRPHPAWIRPALAWVTREGDSF